MSDPRRVLLVGATGLIGREVIARGRNISGIELVALARREVPLPRGARMEMLLAEPSEWPEAIAAIAPNAVICALGTTQAKAGEDGLRQVDQELVIAVGKAALQAGADQFVLVSSVGADPHSRALYLQIKGQAEQLLRKLRFRRLDILRPGLLRGERVEDQRSLERLAQAVSPFTDLLLQGERRRFRSIRAEHVAAAALQAVRSPAKGTFEHEHDGLMRLASNLHRDLSKDS